VPVTQDTEIEALLGRLPEEIRRDAYDSLVGLSVYGSLVTGDFDLLAVVDSDVEGDTFDHLDRMHARFVEDHLAWEDRIEVAYVPASACGTSGPGHTRSQSSARVNLSTSRKPEKISSSSSTWSAKLASPFAAHRPEP
jgi:hypothetical protein